MKTNIIQIIAVLVCSIIFASAIHAQEKVLEYKDKPINFEVLATVADRFADRLTAEPLTTRGFINVYDNSEEAVKIKSVLATKLEIKDRIIFFTPGRRYSEDGSSGVEFWILRDGEYIPYGANCGLCECPTLSVDGHESVSGAEPLTFTANVSGGNGETITYKWRVSAGAIVEGQDSPIIKVDAKGAKEVTATLEIGGVCEECVREASFTSKIKSKLEMIDEFGRVTNEDIEARLDILLQTLSANQKAHAYIINYGSRAAGRRDLVRREMLIRRHFLFRRIDTSRIILIDGGYREIEATEIWLSFDANQKPVLTPTVDAKFVGAPAAKKSTRRKSN